MAIKIRQICLLTLVFCFSVQADKKPDGWNKLQCIWGCSFNSCKNIEILRRCTQNCDPTYLNKCMTVAQSAFGELLPQALRPLLKTEAIKKAPPSPIKKEEDDDDI